MYQLRSTFIYHRSFTEAEFLCQSSYFSPHFLSYSLFSSPPLSLSYSFSSILFLFFFSFVFSGVCVWIYIHIYVYVDINYAHAHTHSEVAFHCTVLLRITQRMCSQKQKVDWQEKIENYYSYLTAPRPPLSLPLSLHFSLFLRLSNSHFRPPEMKEMQSLLTEKNNNPEQQKWKRKNLQILNINVRH